MTLEEMQAQIDALQKALDERKATLPRRSGTTRIGDLEWEHEVTVGVTYADAQQLAQERGEGFRLPTIQELLSLVDYECHDPACSAIDGTPSEQFWTRTAVRGNQSRCWAVSFGGGSVHGIEHKRACAVRLVRSHAKPFQSMMFASSR